MLPLPPLKDGSAKCSAITAHRRADPRIPSTLECHWLEKQLANIGRGNFLHARTLPEELTNPRSPRGQQLQDGRNRELLMAASSGGVATPREFRSVRRLRAVTTADKQVRARWRKQQGRETQGKRGAAAVGEAAERSKDELQPRRDRSRPMVAVGSSVRVRSTTHASSQSHC